MCVRVVHEIAIPPLRAGQLDRVLQRQHDTHWLMATVKHKASSIEPMLLQRVSALPEGRSEWLYQLKLDGYRAIAFKSDGKVVRSRNDKDFSLRYVSITKALAMLPNNTVVDGEIVALDGEGRPSFNLLREPRFHAPSALLLRF